MLNISFALSLDSIDCSTFPVHTYILTPVVGQHGIMFFPVSELIFDHFSTVKEKIEDQMAFLQFIQDGDCLALETGTGPCS